MTKYFLVLILPLSLLWAEIAPKYYIEWQDQAQEALTIEVLDVNKEWCIICRGPRAIEVKAKVTAVKRSKNGLKGGETLTIKYKHVPLGDRSGPRAIPILREKNSYPAFLNKSGDFYRPAARGNSFRDMSAYREK